jgi:hypothetical protein
MTAGHRAERHGTVPSSQKSRALTAENDSGSNPAGADEPADAPKAATRAAAPIAAPSNSFTP